MSIRILQGDCRQVLKTLPDNSVDSVVCDPPYELGFMGKSWDSTGVANDVETWRQCLRVLKPGGHLLAFSGTRTQHRMVCSIEDAGFEIRDQIGWVFGSGFPKSHNGDWGGTALKPAWEPICMARKPLIGTVEANWREHGTGALNIDGCRIESAVPGRARAGEESQDRRYVEAGSTNFAAKPGPRGGDPLGRWPANLVHDGSDEVLAAFPQSAGQQGFVGVRNGDRPSINTYGDWGPRPDTPPRGDIGSAARFFYCAKADRADRNEGLEGLKTDDGRKVPADNAYQRGKTLRQNHHPTVKPTDLMRYLCRLVTPPGGTVLDPFMGSGSTLKAAELEGFSAIGIELDATYIEIARRRIAADAPLFADLET